MSGKAVTDRDGEFKILVDDAGLYSARVRLTGFTDINLEIAVPDTGIGNLELWFTGIARQQSALTVTADVDTDILYPDPAQRVYVRQETLDANPMQALSSWSPAATRGRLPKSRAAPGRAIPLSEWSVCACPLT